MNTYIAFFRGINVGGRNRVPMKELAALLTETGCSGVKSYIQSGNVVFAHGVDDRAVLADRIGSAVEGKFGFRPGIHLLTETELEEAIGNNPFPACEGDPKSLHLGFLSEVPPAPDLAGMEEVRKESENFRLVGTVFYLCAPEGIGRSKLAAKSERLLGVPMTDRNWRTVLKVRELLRA